MASVADDPSRSGVPSDGAVGATSQANAGGGGPSREVLAALGVYREPEPPRWTFASVAAWIGSALLILAAWGVLVAWESADVPFFAQAEPREALAARVMAQGGSFLVIHSEGREAAWRPPLMHWMAALSMRACADLHEECIRFPSKLASLLLAALVWFAGARLQSIRAGTLAGLSLLTMVGFTRYATLALPEMTGLAGLYLAGLSYLFFLRDRSARWIVSFYAGLIVVAFAVGPAPLLPLAATIVLVALVCRDATPLQQIRPLRGAIVVLVPLLLWYGLASLETGGEFSVRAIAADPLFRSSAPLPGVMERHYLEYAAAWLLVGLLPWVVFLPAIGRDLWRSRSLLSAVDGRGFALLWAVVLSGFAIAARWDVAAWVAALCPMVALLAATWVDRVASEAGQGGDATLGITAWVTVPAVAMGAIALGVSAALLMLGWPLETWLSDALRSRDFAALVRVAEMARARPAIVSVAVGLLLIGGSGLMLGAGRTRVAAGAALLFVVGMGGNVLIRQVVLPGVAQAHTQREFIRAVAAVVEPDQAVFFHDVFDFGAAFYAPRRIPTYEGGWPRGAPLYLIKSRGSWEHRRATAIHHYEVARDAEGSRIESGRLVLVRRRDAESR